MYPAKIPLNLKISRKKVKGVLMKAGKFDLKADE
tara:strand:- start:536 stop:637 length:102 start_codon:yes stop_codon:yes gene_type:complete